MNSAGANIDLHLLAPFDEAALIEAYKRMTGCTPSERRQWNPSSGRTNRWVHIRVSMLKRLLCGCLVPQHAGAGTPIVARPQRLRVDT